MANQELVRYRQQELNSGVTREQVTSKLMAAGWQQSDIEAGFRTLQTPPARSRAPWKMLAGTLAALLIVGGAAFATQMLVDPEANSDLTSEIDEEPEVVVETSQTTEVEETKEPKEEPAVESTIAKPEPATSPEILFATRLSTCTPYKMTFEHPLTKDILEKEVVGTVNGKCQYLEQMPNGGLMTCNYSASERAAVSQYYIDVANATSVSTEAHLSSEGSEITYTIDGKVVDNPLQETFTNGTCVITGYN